MAVLVRLRLFNDRDYAGMVGVANAIFPTIRAAWTTSVGGTDCGIASGTTCSGWLVRTWQGASWRGAS